VSAEAAVDDFTAWPLFETVRRCAAEGHQPTGPIRRRFACDLRLDPPADRQRCARCGCWVIAAEPLTLGL
jgi:hypothetical protein